MAASLPTFGALLRRHRRAAGLTQEGLAERAGLSARGVQDLERGLRAAPRAETVRLLAEALGAGRLDPRDPPRRRPPGGCRAPIDRSTRGTHRARSADSARRPWSGANARWPRRARCCAARRSAS